MLRDLSFGLRTLVKNPAFSLTARVTLALGIGASTAIFSVVNAVLLRPLPYANAGRLVLITSDLTARNVNDFPLPPADYKDLVDQATLFKGVAGVATQRAFLLDRTGQPEQIRLARVTPNFFAVLGARMAVGRHQPRRY